MKTLKHLTCVRHGESEGNVKNVREGSESRLSSLGERQTDILAERFEDMRVEAVLTSPYMRAQQTAEKIARVKKMQLEVESRAYERVVPSFVVGLERNDPLVAEFMSKMWALWEQNPDEKVEDGESLTEVFERGRSVLRAIHDRPEMHITLVSHHFFIKALHALVVYGPHPTSAQMRHVYEKYRMSNASLSHFTFHAERGWQLITWNDHTHLRELPLPAEEH